MHVTFLLGNGFDLNVGLKTSYRDFQKAYLKQRGGDGFAKHCRQIVQNDLNINRDQWSDMELALGALSDHYPEKGDNLPTGRKKYCKLLMHMQLKLKEYLLAQEHRIDVEYNQDAICREFEKTLACPFLGLRGAQFQEMKNWWNDRTKEAVNYHFLNFNFSLTFEKCRKLFEDKKFCEKRTPFIRCIDRRKVKDTLEETKYVHGTLDDCIIFGVDHEKQIPNTKLCDDQVCASIIKPIINSRLKNGQAKMAAKLIRQSNLIVIFGMSMGETDRTWWQIIADWLASNEDNRLIVVESSPDKNTGISDSVIQCQNSVQCVFKELLSHAAWQKVEKQILTTINCKIDPVGKHLFDFSVIKPAPEKVPVKQKLQEAGKAFAASYQQTNQTLRGWIGRRKAFFLRFVGKESTGEEIPIADESPLQEAEAVPMPESRYKTASPFNNPPRSAGQSEDTAP